MVDSHLYCPWDGTPYLSNKNCKRCGEHRYVKRPKWEKVLYKKQPFSDTYVDESFLDILEMDEVGYGYEIFSLIQGTTEVCYSLNTLALFFYLFSLAYYRMLSEEFLIALELITLCVGSLLYLGILKEGKHLVRCIKSGLLLLGTLLLLLPILETINKNYADDTVYLLTFTSTVVYLIFNDYSFVSDLEKKIPEAASIVSSLIVSLMVASRLKSGTGIYYTHLLALLLFCLFPYLRKEVKRRSEKVYQSGNFLMNCLCSFLLSTISWKLGAFLIFLFYFIRFACPLWLIYVYDYKNEVKGPWDLPNLKLNMSK